MIVTYEKKFNKDLRPTCEKCFGLCCVALYFSASEGFPTNKDAGKPCINLQSDFTCTVHNKLSEQGLKGCIAYDCFGAGQKVAQVTFNGHDWRENPACANQMFEAFLIMRQLHEILWYLTQTFILQNDLHIKEVVGSLLDITEQLTLLELDSLLELDIVSHRDKVNKVLKSTSEQVRAKAKFKENVNSKKQKAFTRRFDYFGADLRNTNLIAADLRGACLIAANLRGVDLNCADLIGADLRDTDLSGADLSNSIFLTQAQINTAKGDSNTKLPMMIARPDHWLK